MLEIPVDPLRLIECDDVDALAAMEILVDKVERSRREEKAEYERRANAGKH